MQEFRVQTVDVHKNLGSKQWTKCSHCLLTFHFLGCQCGHMDMMNVCKIGAGTSAIYVNVNFKSAVPLRTFRVGELHACNIMHDQSSFCITVYIVYPNVYIPLALRA